MSRLRAGVLTAVIVTSLAVVVGLFAWRARHAADAPASDVERVPANAGRTNLPEAAAEPPVESPETFPHDAADAGAISTPRDYARLYRDADDLLDFIRLVEPAANAGDARALYYAARAARRCTLEYTLYFGRGERERTLNDALVMNAQAKLDEETTRELHRKCQSFKAAPDPPFADWRAALRRAAEAGEPRAQAMIAEAHRHRLVTDAVTDAEKDKLRAEMHEFARAAIRSRDPEVMFRLAPVASYRIEDWTTGEVDAIWNTWMIAACQRGYDCGRNSEDFRYLCQFDAACQPFETLVDIVRRTAGSSFDELQQRATELNGKIDAGLFDELGL